MRKITLFILLAPFLLGAQVLVVGLVVDDQQNALSYTTIAFKSIKTPNRLEGTFSSLNGKFELMLPPDQYQITFQMIGYQNVVMDAVQIVSEMDLGIIILQTDVTELEEVVVRAERSYVENDLGKRTLYIGADLANSGSTAINALEALPSVTTSVQGTISVRGSENVIIYVNGQETKRDPKTLQFISADALQKIELITNPSAKYDAEGVAGIINLVYNKSRSTKLDVFGSIAAPFRGSLGLNGSISSEKFFLYVNANERRSNYENYDQQIRITPNDSLTNYRNRVTSIAQGMTREITAGLSYESDTSFSIGLEANYLRWDDVADQDQFIFYSYINGSEGSNQIVNDNTEIEDELTFTLSSEKRIAKNGSLKLQLTTGGEDEINRTNYNRRNVDLSGSPIRQLVLKSDETEDQRYYRAKVDYTTPIKEKVNLEAGFVSDFFKLNVNQFLGFADEVEVSNLFRIQMNKYAGYALIEDTRHRFEYALGVRFESFESKSINKATDSTFTQRFDNVFPSIQWKYNFGKSEHSLGFNFTRRINRPSFWEASPFLSYTDPLNLETGNPFLKPEFGYLYELTYSNTLGKLSLDLTAFRRTTDNVIQQVIKPLNDEQFIVTYQNFGTKNNDGIELSTSYDLTKRISIEGSGSTYRTSFSDDDERIVYQNRWNSQIRLSQRYRSENGWGVDLTQYVRGPRYNVQSVSIGQHYLNVSVQKSFKENKGTVTLSFSDILNSRVFGTDLVGEGFELNNEYRFQTQMLRLSLRYKIIQ